MNYKKKPTLSAQEIVIKKSGRNFTRPKPIKPFKTLEEEAEFWDTHDISKVFENPKTPLSELDELEPKKEVVLTLRLQKSVKEKIDKLARSKGINPATLSRMWLIEKLREEVSEKNLKA